MLKKFLIISAVVLMTASFGFAGNVQTFGVGSSATAQGEAVAAYSDDPFAVYYNPAGLTLSKGPVVSVGAMMYDPKIEITNFKVNAADGTDLNAAAGRPSSFQNEDDLIVNPHIGFSMPINEQFFFGIATYAPYGLHAKWNADPAVSPGSSYAYESLYGRQVITPSAAYKFSDKLSFGFGVSLGKSVSEAAKVYEVSEVFTSPLSPAYNSSLAMLDGADLRLEAEDELNYSFNAGIMYMPIEKLSLGLTYRGRTETDFEGDAILTNANVLDPNTGLPVGKTNLNGSVTMEYDHPESIQAGARYFFSEKLAVEFDMTWTRWSILDSQTEVVSFAELNEPIVYTHNRDWEDTIQYKIGTQWQAFETVNFRAGYTYDPTPIPDETFDFGWPDTDRSVFNIGCGWNITEKWTLDSVIQYVNSTPTRSLEGNSAEMNKAYGVEYGQPVNVYLDDEGTLWGLGLTVSYAF